MYLLSALHTDWVSACATGSAIALEVIDPGEETEKHRVHFYHGAKVSAEATDSDQVKTWYETGTFIEVDSSGSISEPMDIDGNEDAEQLKAEITEWAEDAGVPPP